MTDWKPIILTGKAIIKTDTETIEITPDDLEWETDSEDASMGANLTHTATCYFDGGEVTWTFCEYPQGTLNGDCEVEINGAEIIQDFEDYQLPPESEDEDYQLPPEPEDADEPPEDWTSDYTPPKDSDFENDPRLKDF